VDRRVLTRNIDSDHEVGKVGTDQVQLYSKDGKLYAQLSSNDAVLISDLSTGSATPVGAVNAYAGDTAPAGWLLCDGGAVTNGSSTVQGQTADFSDLYALLGTTYGSAGTLPDLAGRVIAQEDGTYARGVEGGAVGVGLVAGNVPAHNHGLTATINSTVSDNSSVDGYGTPWSNDPTDTQEIPDDPYAPHDAYRRAEIYDGSSTGDYPPEHANSFDRPYLNMRADKDWDHYFDVTSAFAGSSTTDNSTGTGSTHENRQPTLYMNYIIKF
jgi:microcystin-dependent protein